MSYTLPIGQVPFPVRRDALLADGSRPVAEGYAVGLQAAQERLACPFGRGGVMLAGGKRQGVRHAARQAQGEIPRDSG